MSLVYAATHAHASSATTRAPAYAVIPDPRGEHRSGDRGEQAGEAPSGEDPAVEVPNRLLGTASDVAAGVRADRAPYCVPSRSSARRATGPRDPAASGDSENDRAELPCSAANGRPGRQRPGHEAADEVADVDSGTASATALGVPASSPACAKAARRVRCPGRRSARARRRASSAKRGLTVPGAERADRRGRAQPPRRGCHRVHRPAARRSSHVHGHEQRRRHRGGTAVPADSRSPPGRAPGRGEPARCPQRARRWHSPARSSRRPGRRRRSSSWPPTSPRRSPNKPARRHPR